MKRQTIKVRKDVEKSYQAVNVIKTVSPVMEITKQTKTKLKRKSKTAEIEIRREQKSNDE